jgi:hypothetical protein
VGEQQPAWILLSVDSDHGDISYQSQLAEVLLSAHAQNSHPNVCKQPALWKQAEAAIETTKLLCHPTDGPTWLFSCRDGELDIQTFSPAFSCTRSQQHLKQAHKPESQIEHTQRALGTTRTEECLHSPNESRAFYRFKFVIHAGSGNVSSAPRPVRHTGTAKAQTGRT